MPLTRASVLAAAVALVAAACGSSSPSSAPSPSPSVSPTPTLPPVAADEANAKAALLTAAELGKPWVQPKSVNEQKNAKGEFCPGVKDDDEVVKPRAKADVDMTEGTQRGAPIGSFAVFTYDPAQIDAWRAAYAGVTEKCKTYVAADKTHVTTEPLTSPPAVDGADEVVGRIERIYADAAHKTLYYVRPALEARFGRVVVYVQYSYIQPKTDPTGKDLTTIGALLAKQAAKVRTTFGV